MVTVNHLGFFEIQFFNGQWVKGVTLHYRAYFHSDRSECCCDMTIFRFFFKMAVRHLGFVARVLTTHEEYFIIFIAVRNRVHGVDAAVSIICKF